VLYKSRGGNVPKFQFGVRIENEGPCTKIEGPMPFIYSRGGDAPCECVQPDVYRKSHGKITDMGEMMK
jgi:hypothetical protein